MSNIISWDGTNLNNLTLTQLNGTITNQVSGGVNVIQTNHTGINAFESVVIQSQSTIITGGMVGYMQCRFFTGLILNRNCLFGLSESPAIPFSDRGLQYLYNTGGGFRQFGCTTGAGGTFTHAQTDPGPWLDLRVTFNISTGFQVSEAALSDNSALGFANFTNAYVAARTWVVVNAPTTADCGDLRGQPLHWMINSFEQGQIVDISSVIITDDGSIDSIVPPVPPVSLEEDGIPVGARWQKSGEGGLRNLKNPPIIGGSRPRGFKPRGGIV